MTVSRVGRLRRTAAQPALESVRDRLWSARDVARYLHVSVAWVYRAAEHRELPYRRIGALLRFAPEEIVDYANRARE